MVSVESFLDLLEEKDLLPSTVMAKLRQQVAHAKTPPKASGVAKALIEKGYLTPMLAKRLLGSDDDGGAKKTAAKNRPSASQSPAARSAEFMTSGAPPSLLDDELMPLDAGAAAPATSGPASFDGLMSGSALEMTGGGESAPLAAGRKKNFLSFFRRSDKPKKKEDWGSVFMLAGGGSLLLMIGAIGLLYWWLNRQGWEEKYAQCTEYYKATSYEQAIKSYDEFVKDFSGRPEASSARFWRGLAEMRQVEQGGDWVECLKTANTTVEVISHESNFSEANPELAALLPKIAEGLSNKAMAQSSPELVAKTREALTLIDKFVPKSMSQPTKLADIETRLGVTERNINQNKELDKGIAAIKDAIKQQKTIEAYSIRRVLLKKYPKLLENEQLAAAMAEITKAQHAAVKSVAENKAAAKDEAPSPILAAVALAQRSAHAKTALEDVPGRVVCVAAEGAAYGIEAATGKLLWQRFVGYPQSGQNIAPPPTPVSAEVGASLLVADTSRNEMLRIKSAAGKLEWRCPLGEPFNPQPVLAGNRLLVSAPSGKVFALDLENGDSAKSVQLPQPLRVAPAVDKAQGLIYQVAEHSNLYILGLDDFSCKQVCLLGHEAGSITSAPAVISGYLVIGVNEGALDSSLRLFAMDRGSTEKPGITLKPIQQIPLKGCIDITPAVDGNRLLVATDHGVVRVFDLTPTDKGTQLRDVAETAIEGGENVARFALLQGGQFWIADIRLTKYDVVGSKGRLVPKWTIDEGSVFLQPPIAAGSSVISVRRKAKLPGLFVSAVGIDEPTRSWETLLAAPPAGELITGGTSKKITAVTKLGGLFQLDAVNLKGPSILDAPAVSIDPAALTQPIGAVTPMEKDIIALSAFRGETKINVFDPGESQTRYRWVSLSDKDKSACPPIDLGGGLLVPSQGGAIFLLDPRSGKPLAAPFQAKLETGVQTAWQQPAACGKQDFVIGDGRNTLYRIGRVDSPKPHLAVLDQVEMAQTQDSPAAVVGNSAFVVGATQTLGIFELPKLKRMGEQKLSGRCVWGPVALGDRVLLATDDNQLLCLDAKGEKLWQAALTYGALAGKPLPVQEGYLLASTGGVIWRIDAKTGKELAKVETGRALATGPAAMEDLLFVGGADGCIYEVKQP